MMNPEMMKMAQEKMAQMGPEQIAQMQANMKNITPEMMRATMQQMQNMSSDDVKRAKDRMNGMSPDEMMRQSKELNSSNFQQRYTAQNKYSYDASLSLKKEGNQLIAQKEYNEAKKKYNRAIENLKNNNYQGSGVLRLSCNLNLVLCCLKLNENEKAIKRCTELLKVYPNNIKVWYRRGIAYTQMGEYERASVDLERALEHNPGDEIIEKAYKEALDKSADQMKVKEAEEALKEEKRQAEEERKKKEEVDKKVDMMSRAASQISKNPEMVKQMGNKLANMDDDELKKLNEMSKAQGMPEISPDMAKMAAKNIASMEPDQLQNMIKLSQAMNPTLAPSSSSSSSSSSSLTSSSAASSDDEGEAVPASSATPTAAGMPNFGMDQMANVSKMMENPAMMDMMQKMMQSMSPKDLQAQMKMAGKDLTIEEAEKYVENMKNLKPEHMQKLLKVGTCCTKAYSWFRWLYTSQYLRGAIGGILIATAWNYIF